MLNNAKKHTYTEFNYTFLKKTKQNKTVNAGIKAWRQNWEESVCLSNITWCLTRQRMLPKKCFDPDVCWEMWRDEDLNSCEYVVERHLYETKVTSAIYAHVY